jgi:katanin p60 ATPase-containing subunit A1
MEISDIILREKWKKVEDNINVEINTITQIQKYCETFNSVYSDSGDQKARNLEGVNLGGMNDDPKGEQIKKDADLLRQIQGDYPIEKQEKKYNKAKQSNDAQDILNDINYAKNISNQVQNQINNIQNNYNNNRRKEDSKNEPSGGYNNILNAMDNISKPSRQQQQPRSQQNNNYNNNNNRPVPGNKYNRVNPMNQINNALNNYQPSKKMYDKYGKLANYGPDGYYKGGSGNSNQRSGNSNNNNKGKDGKSAFLLNHYPDGNGPDAELIEMLEREVVDTNPQVRFEDIAELDGAKKTLQEAVLLPLLIPDYFKGIRRPWRGVLLYGPPGTGKTMLAKALATQGKTTFFNVHSSSFASKWRGESEKLVRILFEMARFYAPTTIFIDEVDSLCSKRGEGGEGDGSRRVKSEFLVQMEGVNSNTSASANEQQSPEEKRKNVTVMAATNRPWDLDDALRRRFEKRVYIPLPNEKGRSQLFNLNLKKINIDKNLDMNKLIKATDGYSGADIANVCREAALMPMRRELKANKGRNIEDLVDDPEFRGRCEAPIGMDDLLSAIGNISKSVSQKDLEVYDKWTSEFSSV